MKSKKFLFLSYRNGLVTRLILCYVGQDYCLERGGDMTRDERGMTDCYLPSENNLIPAMCEVFTHNFNEI